MIYCDNQLWSRDALGVNATRILDTPNDWLKMECLFHFIIFLLKKNKERRDAWIRACCRKDTFVCTKDSYICSLHFVEKTGPTDKFPDPIPATASRDKVCHLFSITIFTAEK